MCKNNFWFGNMLNELGIAVYLKCWTSFFLLVSWIMSTQQVFKEHGVINIQFYVLNYERMSDWIDNISLCVIFSQRSIRIIKNLRIVQGSCPIFFSCCRIEILESKMTLWKSQLHSRDCDKHWFLGNGRITIVI